MLGSILCLTLLTVPTLLATDRRWTGDAFNNTWSEPKNWAPTGVPQDGDILRFGNNASRQSNRNDLPNLTLQSLVFDGSSGGYTLSGNPVKLNADITAAHNTGFNSVRFDVVFTHGGGTFSVARAGRLEISGQVTLANNGLLGINTLGTNLVLSGSITGAGSIEKYGERDLILSGSSANSYIGATRVFEGTVRLEKSAGVRAVSAEILLSGIPQSPVTLIDGHSGQYPAALAVHVGPYATWTLENPVAVSGLSLNKGRIVGPGILELSCNVTNEGHSDIRCPIYLGTNTRVFDTAEDSELQLLGFILGPSGGASPPGLTKTGFGSLFLGNQATYSGETTIEAGELHAGHPEALGATTGFTRVGLNARLVLGDSPRDFSLPQTFLYAETILLEGGDLEAKEDVVVTGPIKLSVHTRVVAPRNARLELRTSISGPGGMELIGGTLRLSGPGLNTFSGSILVTADGFYSPPVLELGKAADQIAVPSTVVLRGFGTNQATLRNFQQNGVTQVRLHDGGFWDLHGHTAAPESVIFLGGGVVDAGFDGPLPGELVIDQAGPDQGLQLLPRELGPNDYTAFIWGHMSFRQPSSEVLVPSQITLALFGDIQAQGPRKTGAGILALNGNNLAMERFEMSDGEVVAWHNNALGVEPRVLPGATAWLMTTFPRGPITVEGHGFLGRGALSTDRGPIIVGGGLHLAGPTSLGTLHSNSLMFIDGTIDGQGPLIKEGPGLLALQGTTPNTFIGDMVVKDGLFIPAKSAFVPAVPGNLVVGSGDPTRGPARVLYGDHDQVWNGITVNAGGLVDLDRWDEACGEVVLNDGGSIRTGSGTLYLGAGVDIQVNATRGFASSFLSGHLSLGAGSHRIRVGGDGIGLTSQLSLQAQITQYDGAAGLVKEGPGLLRLSESNAFSGDFVISEGRVLISNANALGASSGGTFVNGGSTLSLQAPLWITEEPLTFNSTNLIALESIGGSNTWSGPITLQRNTGIHTAGDDLWLSSYFDCCSGIIRGPGGIVKHGDKTLRLTGFWGNEYQGSTVILQGGVEAWRVFGPAIPGDVVVAGAGASLQTGIAGAPTGLSATASITIQQGAEWRLNSGNRETIGSLQGHGRLSIAPDLGTTASLIINNPQFCQFDGPLAGFGSLEKRGVAGLTLTGDGLFYGGTITVSEGALRVDGRLPSAPAIVRAGAQLRGDGALGTVTASEQDSVVQIDGSFRDHAERQTGDLEVLHLDLGAGAVVGFDLAGFSPTGGNDQLIAHGPVTLNNPRLSVDFRYPPTEGEVITLLDNRSPVSINGTFKDFPEGVVRKVGDVPVLPSYHAGDGNDFALTITNLALSLRSYRLAEGNGNQSVEPDECNLLYLSLLNRRETPLRVTNAWLRALTPGAVVTIGSAPFPELGSGSAAENLRPIQFTTGTNLSCGQEVRFELVLGVATEGVFAVRVTVPGGDSLACQNSSGGCDSCTRAHGRLSASSRLLTRAPLFVGGPSLCYPPKRCPELEAFSKVTALPYETHSFHNPTDDELCITARLLSRCVTNVSTLIGVIAYASTNDYHDPCAHYLGDSGVDGTQSFSFRAPPHSDVLLQVSARTVNLPCADYTLELFGLPCPPPTLRIAHAATENQVVVSWTTSDPGFSLQVAERLAGELDQTWTESSQRGIVSHGSYTVTNAATGAQTWYRLHKP